MIRSLLPTPIRLFLPFFALLPAFAGALTGNARGAPAERPNILFVFTDDQRWDAVGYEGNPVIQTPTLDRLARSGVIFNNSFVATSICAVNRASVMIGEYPRRHGIDNFYKIFDEEQLDRTYPALLRENGYYTGFVGKWGIGHTAENTYTAVRIFDFWAGASHQTNFWHEADCPYVVNNGRNNICTCGPDARGVKGPAQRSGKAGIENPVHLTTKIFPRKVETFLETRAKDKPFCLSLFYKAPHGPLDPADEYQDLYADQAMPIPPTAEPRFEKAKPQFLRRNETMLGAAAGRKWVENPKQLATQMRDSYRLVTGIDNSMAQVLKLLRKHGVAENTIIVFTSDNGNFFGDHGMAGKWLMREQSIRVPGFVYDPRLPEARRGTRLEESVMTLDFTSSILDWAGVPQPKNMQGRSFVGLIEGRERDEAWSNEWFYEHPYTHGGALPFTVGVRTDRYKYTRYTNREPVFEEFFDLALDPHETENRIDNPHYQKKIQDLRQRTDTYAEALK